MSWLRRFLQVPFFGLNCPVTPLPPTHTHARTHTHTHTHTHTCILITNLIGLFTFEIALSDISLTACHDQI